MEIWRYGEMGSFCKSMKIKKTITFAELKKEVYKIILIFQGVFGMRYIRMFCKFPG